jgi:hypothetical protein
MLETLIWFLEMPEIHISQEMSGEGSQQQKHGDRLCLTGTGEQSVGRPGIDDGIKRRGQPLAVDPF